MLPVGVEFLGRGVPEVLPFCADGWERPTAASLRAGGTSSSSSELNK